MYLRDAKTAYRTRPISNFNASVSYYLIIISYSSVLYLLKCNLLHISIYKCDLDTMGIVY